MVPTNGYDVLNQKDFSLSLSLSRQVSHFSSSHHYPLPSSFHHYEQLAAVGWPAAELWDRQAAALAGLPSLLDLNDGLNPSLLNGGLLSLVRRGWLEWG